MPRYKITIQYDGAAYAGWQIQPNDPTVQQTLMECLEKILQKKTKITGSGRTDSGVHALEQVAHFDTENRLQPQKFLDSLNGLLPHDIRVQTLEEVSEEFHALFSAKKKIYHYRLSLNRYRSPFDRFYTTHIKHTLDLELLCKAAALFVGTHDFTSFANSAKEGAAAKNAVRTIYRLDVIEEEEGGVRLEFEGNGFLYKMVRNITGMLLEVSRGKRPIEDIPRILEAKDRRLASKAAHAAGLTLVKVFY